MHRSQPGATVGTGRAGRRSTKGLRDTVGHGGAVIAEGGPAGEQIVSTVNFTSKFLHLSQAHHYMITMVFLFLPYLILLLPGASSAFFPEPGGAGDPRRAGTHASRADGVRAQQLLFFLLC